MGEWIGESAGVRSLILAGLLALVLTGCGLFQAEPTPFPPRTPAPLPLGALGLALETDAPATPVPHAEWACPAALLAPVRVLRSGDTVTFRMASNEADVTLIWPRGFSARLVAGRVEIVAPDGAVIAREEDLLANMLGGAGDAQGFHICSVSNRIYPPAS